MDNVELMHRFKYHPPKDDETVELHETVRDTCKILAEGFNALLPEGREKSLAMTHIEEVMFWANAAIARDRE